MTTDTLKPEELRIGNWLLYDEDGKWTNQQVQYVAAGLQGYNGYYVSFGWATTTLQCDISNFDDWELYVKGIPLTPEILEKCGLNENVNTGWYMIQFTVKKSGRWITRESALSETDDLKEPFLRIDGIADVYFVHQLQNLIYALTQTEIEIQL